MLQIRGVECLRMTSHDADLQQVGAAWESAPPAIRRAILALLNAFLDNADTR